MQHLIFIALGGAAGSVLRYVVSTSTYTFLGTGFPYGTLVVNALGSLLMGFLSVLLLERFDGMGYELRSLLLIGFLGGFTTFSAFSFETLELLRNGMLKESAINMVLSILLCVTLVWIGMLVGKKV